MDLTMSMFATQADYWRARAGLAEEAVDTMRRARDELDIADMLGLGREHVTDSRSSNHRRPADTRKEIMAVIGRPPAALAACRMWS